MKRIALVTAAAAAAGLLAASSSQAKLTRDARTLLHASRTITPQQQLRLANRTIWTGRTTLRFLSTHPKAGTARSRGRLARDASWLLRFGKSARSLAVARLVPPHPVVTGDGGEFACIHRHEGAWNANTGNGFYGGLQMDYGFQRTYGAEFMRRWGTADRWPMWAQVVAARRARDGYGAYGARGYGPWPNTARECGLL